MGAMLTACVDRGGKLRGITTAGPACMPPQAMAAVLQHAPVVARALFAQLDAALAREEERRPGDVSRSVVTDTVGFFA